MTQNKIDSLITSFVTKAMYPLATAKQKEFICLVQGLCQGAKVMSRGTLGRRINEDNKTANLKERLKCIYVCTSADIWSTRKTSYMGVTVHWIQTDTPERESAALPCRHFSSPHTYNRIVKLLEEIHSKYGLTTDTIVATVTDNASNFSKAFREFSITVVSEEQDEAD